MALKCLQDLGKSLAKNPEIAKAYQETIWKKVTSEKFGKQKQLHLTGIYLILQ